ncbi:uncharacterized protein [Prorops nasuta]|uniref:uncharacterized protein n=1 Tax=Prorops nasuta TaxID=863751 RepID=UPI0034CEB5CF
MAVSLSNAKEQFFNIMRDLTVQDKRQFLSFIIQEWQPQSFNYEIESELEDSDDVLEDPIFALNCIADDIKKIVPFDATFPSENIRTPKLGENSDCLPSSTMHVDGFLYTDEDLSELEKSGEFKKYYCATCGSKNLQSYIIISHSMSRDELYHIFNSLLPTLEEKTVLDIGSRLGAVVYGAYVFTDARKIIGVEMNKDLCNLQSTIMQKYKMANRIEILNKRIEEASDVVNNSDVIIINNSFEFYLSVSEQTEVWTFLKNNIRKGTLLVIRPVIEAALKNLQTGIVINEWLRPYTIVDDPKFDDIACYEVI